MKIETVSDFRRAVRNGPYTQLGGYPVYWLVSDGEACAFDVAKTERRQMLDALVEYQSNRSEHSGWRPVALEINYHDCDLICAHTGRRISAAYEECD